MRNDSKPRQSFGDRGGSRNFGGSRGGSRNFGGNRGNRFGGSNRGGFQRNNFDRGPREMHKATCSECKKECEVPFKPTEGREVFCKECYEKHKPSRF